MNKLYKKFLGINKTKLEIEKKRICSWKNAISIHFVLSTECWSWRSNSKICSNQLRIESVFSELGIFQQFWITTNSETKLIFPDSGENEVVFDFIQKMTRKPNFGEKTRHKFRCWFTFDKQNFPFNQFKRNSHSNAFNSKNQFRSTF